MTIAEEFRDMVVELLGEFGSAATWRRATLTEAPGSGTVSESNVQTGTVTAAAARGDLQRLLPAELAAVTEVALVVAADGFPFAPVAPAVDGAPQFADMVTWDGVQRRVISIETIAGAGGAGAPARFAYIVALGA